MITNLKYGLFKLNKNSNQTLWTNYEQDHALQWNGYCTRDDHQRPPFDASLNASRTGGRRQYRFLAMLGERNVLTWPLICQIKRLNLNKTLLIVTNPWQVKAVYHSITWCSVFHHARRCTISCCVIIFMSIAAMLLYIIN